jgi:hypothetical protein
MSAAIHVDTNARIRTEVEWNKRPGRSWRWTFLGPSRFVRVMDDETAELIAALCTRAGMIMEDVSDLALTIRSTDREERSSRLARLKEASLQITALVDAAIALDR